MPKYDAVLLDVFETVLCVDQVRHAALLAERAGVSATAFAEAAGSWGPRINDGRASLAEAVAAVLARCGATPDDETVAALVAADRDLLAELAVVPDDTVPFLRSLRAAGTRTAFVSNCAENTRPLLDGLGLTALVDELVLSCEVGATKPDRAIFDVALERLGTAPERAVLVDDQQSYCDGAAALGIDTVRIDRTGGTGQVSSLAEVSAYL
ncbi:MAG: HAD family hydrolase [Nocardioides sp.]|nr:HAD family hydrolase [Nocardioidaceae bacterium]MCB8955525.1 HAD family hydrolase [Nocardioides sp.]